MPCTKPKCCWPASNTAPLDPPSPGPAGAFFGPKTCAIPVADAVELAPQGQLEPLLHLSFEANRTWAL